MGTQKILMKSSKQKVPEVKYSQNHRFTPENRPQK